jgi:hypothetical protein
MGPILKAAASQSMKPGHKRIGRASGVIEAVKEEVALDVIVGDFRILVSKSVK